MSAVTSGVEVRTLTLDEIPALSQIIGWAFGMDPATVPEWLEHCGHDNVRVALSGGRVAGSLVQIPMGQWFGEKSVPTLGIAGVAIAPEARGHGIAMALMRSTLNELAEAGIALSTLYPSTQALYRAVGYEQAGSRFRISVRPSDLPHDVRELAVRPIEDGDRDAIAAAYGRYASVLPGYLDRSDYIWRRVRNPRRDAARGYLVAADAEVEGYLYVAQRRTQHIRYDLHASDFVALTPRAGQRLLAFVADHRSLSDEFVWHGGPNDGLLALLPEQTYRMELASQFMLRIVDVERALAARGYPAGIEAELEIDVRDALLPNNTRRFVLRVAEGAADVAQGGGGSLSVDMRGLAALYSGFLSPHALRRLGLLEGGERALGTATALFTGAAPAMPDQF